MHFSVRLCIENISPFFFCESVKNSTFQSIFSHLAQRTRLDILRSETKDDRVVVVLVQQISAMLHADVVVQTHLNWLISLISQLSRVNCPTNSLPFHRVALWYRFRGFSRSKADRRTWFSRFSLPWWSTEISKIFPVTCEIADGQIDEFSDL